MLSAALVTVSCLHASPSFAIEIENFRAGLDCQSPNNEREYPGWICFETETVHITGQGRCTYDEKQEQCTWYGFEFDYKNLARDEEVSCTSSSSQIGDIGNPNGVVKRNAVTYQYVLELEPGSGHYYNPQYTLFHNDLTASQVIETTSCSVGDKELFQFKFRLLFPEVASK